MYIYVAQGVGVAELRSTTFGTVVLRRAHIANTVGRLRKVDPPETHIACRDDGLSTASSLGFGPAT